MTNREDGDHRRTSANMPVEPLVKETFENSGEQRETAFNGPIQSGPVVTDAGPFGDHKVGAQNVTHKNLVKMNMSAYFRKIMDKQGGIESILDEMESSDSDYDDAAS